MDDLTQMLGAIERGEAGAAQRLLPLVYDELRRLASRKLAHERPGHTLEATALVHEAYVRLIGESGTPSFANRRHFFAAAAEAMRRILVESARRKQSLKRGGGLDRTDCDLDHIAAPQTREDLIALDEALTKLAAAEPDAVELVHLRYFAGLSIPQAAELLGISPRSADRLWAYARSWLHREIKGESS